jgi:hypothetical protein
MGQLRQSCCHISQGAQLRQLLQSDVFQQLNSPAQLAQDGGIQRIHA